MCSWGTVASVDSVYVAKTETHTVLLYSVIQACLLDGRPFHRGDLHGDVMRTCTHAEMWSQLNCGASKRDGIHSHSHDIVRFAAHSDLKHS